MSTCLQIVSGSFFACFLYIKITKKKPSLVHLRNSRMMMSRSYLCEMLLIHLTLLLAFLYIKIKNYGNVFFTCATRT
jgi:hypothetical protein